MKFLILNSQTNIMPNYLPKCPPKLECVNDDKPCTKGGGGSYVCGHNSGSRPSLAYYC